MFIIYNNNCTSRTALLCRLRYVNFNSQIIVIIIIIKRYNLRFYPLSWWWVTAEYLTRVLGQNKNKMKNNIFWISAWFSRNPPFCFFGKIFIISKTLWDIFTKLGKSVYTKVSSICKKSIFVTFQISKWRPFEFFNVKFHENRYLNQNFARDKQDRTFKYKFNETLFNKIG